LPEPYWAPISTIVVMQSSLGASWAVSWRRLVGTMLGSVVGAALAMIAPRNFWLFVAGVAALGAVCRLARLDRVAYRFAGVTLAIVLLISREQHQWIMAAHRCIEVSIGIAAALAVTALWPDHVPQKVARTRSSGRGASPR
jgi:uncharacterized membrane protein YgaE (UPF0421/DUF939 family)